MLFRSGRCREPVTMQPSDQTPAHLADRLVAGVPHLPDAVVARRLGDERNGDLHLRPPLVIERKKLLDDGQHEPARVGLVEMTLDAGPCPPPDELRGVHEQVGLAGEDVPDRSGGDSCFRGDGADGDATDALGVNDSPGGLCYLLPATVVIDELGHTAILVGAHVHDSVASFVLPGRGLLPTGSAAQPRARSSHGRRFAPTGRPCHSVT